jgi:hypothetical protein
MLDPSNGDIWAYYVLFARNHLQAGDDAKLIKTAFNRGTLSNGFEWNQFKKSQAQFSDDASQDLFIQFITTLSPPL